MGDTSTAHFRLGNLTTRPLPVVVDALRWRTLMDPPRQESFAIKSMTATGGAMVAGSTITVEPGTCVSIDVVASGTPVVGYHVRAAYEATFAVDGASVVARSDDMFFRYPRGAR